MVIVAGMRSRRRAAWSGLTQFAEVERVKPCALQRGGLCGLDGRASGEKPSERRRNRWTEPLHGLAKVRVAGSNPVVRSKSRWP